MPYRKQQFANNEIYHVATRGLDDNLLFKDMDDYYRGIFSLYEFNTLKSITIRGRRKVRKRIKDSLQTQKPIRDPISVVDTRDKIVDILAFCLMPNHIHLLLRQLKDGGLIKFMQKFGAGFAGYFNKKYSRKGHVFQNRFLPVLIKDERQLMVASTYVHTNPVALIEPHWKENGVSDADKAIEFLENYKWSSYQDYIGKNNFSSVTERDFLSELMGGAAGCKQFVDDWIKQKEEIKKLSDQFDDLGLE